ncbi:MAG: glycoside hydrolase, partial [Actinobacteria bacterium]|nr:glycoside hydrolase [Actinomycetota bacterium]
MRRTVTILLAALVVLAGAAPAGALITGVDVASYQHPGGAPIDWVKVRSAGHRYALVKATEGTTYTNPYFNADWTGAAAAGLYRGAYHYARPALPITSALDQARYFVSKAGSMT